MPESIDNVKVYERLASIETVMNTVLQKTDHIARMSESLARMQEQTRQHDGQLEILFQKVGNAEAIGRTAKEDVSKWVNRGLGAYAVGSIFISLVAFLLFRIVGDYDGKIRNYGDSLVTIDRRVTWIEWEQKGRIDGHKKDSGDGRIR